MTTYQTTDETTQDCPKCSTFSARKHQRACTSYRGMIPCRELRLADVVDLGGIDGYSYATVSNIRDGLITFYRPYTHTADFSYTGGVICYLGIETFSRQHDSADLYRVTSRRELK